MKEILRKSASEINKIIQNKEVKVSDVVEIQLNHIREMEPKINSYITVFEDEAIKRANEIQDSINKGELSHSKIAGVPIAVKDNICIKGIRTTAASRVLSDFEPIYNATVIDKINRAGGIIIGKTNMDEFAMGSTSTTSYAGYTHNPNNLDYVPGGSSGGSAAAIAANEAFLSLGTDTGGSIRQPASFCGVVGMKPSYGRVSRYGLIAFASSFDQIGPFAKNVSDAAMLFDVIYGTDQKDSNMPDNQRFSYTGSITEDVKGMKIGIPAEFMASELDQDIRQSINKAIEVLKERGAIVEEFRMETSKYIKPVYYVLSSAEASSNFGRYDGIRFGKSEGFGTEVIERILLGSYALSGDNYFQIYEQALKIRRLIKMNIDDTFKKYNIILGPTVPDLVPSFMEYEKEIKDISSSTTYTAIANLAGIPAINVPCGIDRRGLPIGLQFMAGAFDEEKLFRVAYTFEQAIGFENLIKRE